MRVFIRVDSSKHIGTGHVWRCMTLAEALRKQGAEIRFVCRACPGNLIGILQERTMHVTALPTDMQTPATDTEDYNAWLGVSQEADAEQTLEAVGSERVDWLVVDHYGIGEQWEQRLRAKVAKVMVIDDLVNRRHDCDLLLNQNWLEQPEVLHSTFASPACRLLLGPRYALLRPEYADYHQATPERAGEVGRVFVFFGGSDLKNLTGLTLQVLSAPEFRHLQVDVVVGMNNPHRQVIEKQVSQRRFTVYHGPRPHLADLMAQADLAVSAGGSTIWEQLCLGLPTLVVNIAENQEPASAALANAGLIVYVGKASEVQPRELRAALRHSLRNREVLRSISSLGKRLVDGRGVSRVVDVLSATLH